MPKLTYKEISRFIEERKYTSQTSYSFEKPQLKDFGLNENEYEELLEIESNLPEHKYKIAVYTFSYLIVGISLTLFLATSTKIGFSTDAVWASFIIIALLGSFIAFMIDSQISGSIQEKQNKRLKPLKDYKEALTNWENNQRLKSEEFWLQLSGYLFEKEVAALFSRNQFKTILTQRSRDNGIDIILERDNKIILVQCKNHSKPIGPAVARELFGVMASTNINYGIIVATFGQSKESEKFLIGKNIALLDVDDLIRIQEKGFSNNWEKDLFKNDFQIGTLF